MKKNQDQKEKTAAPGKEAKPEKAKPEKAKPEKAKPEKANKADTAATLVSLAATLGRVSRCLVMCAPRFPDGSEGAAAVELATRSIPAVRTILASVQQKGGGK